MKNCTRREFLNSSAAITAATPLLFTSSSSLNAEVPKKRIGIIGHTGRGNYGHGLDTVWLKIPGAEIVGVADANQLGLMKEMIKLNLSTKLEFASSQVHYTDYLMMLEKTNPRYVSVCPRHVDQHAELVLACLEHHVKGIYIEKPFCRTPAEADRIIKLAEKKQAKIAVAHRNRYHPALPVIRKQIEEGLIGKLLEIRGRGKGDSRGGIEDLWVLGSHVLDMVHYFAGDPVSCSAVVMKDGKRITKADVHAGNEGIGATAGNEVHARYEMSSGVMAYFDSIANDGSQGAGFGLQLVGSKGIISMRCDREPVAHLIPGNPFLPSDEPRPWIPVTSGGVDVPEPHPEVIANVHNHVAAVQNLIDAVESEDSDQQPLCDVRAAATTVEMICAVLESHRQDSQAVKFPLQQRENAFDLL